MKIEITSHHISITESIESAVNAKIKKITNHFPDIESIHVHLKVEKHEQSAEAVVHYLGQDLVAKDSADELYQAIPKLAKKLESLLQHRKDTVKSHRRSAADTSALDTSALDTSLNTSEPASS